ncbi:MAG: hypothetical protein NVS2B4_01280 [Ramlibacter sp.]
MRAKQPETATQRFESHEPCEEFLLAMRQNKRLLMYATSRSLRLPEFAVNIAGIPPDPVLPMPCSVAERERE